MAVVMVVVDERRVGAGSMLVEWEEVDHAVVAVLPRLQRKMKRREGLVGLAWLGRERLE